ncbi:MAG: glycoside hydrolase family 3 N-terminal domain-containing protein [Ignavibacteria bacterium]|nr:glycoside hydrolase family 3 N-terminal domain-containing protein [Ignavibacteria bacterium]
MKKIFFCFLLILLLVNTLTESRYSYSKEPSWAERTLGKMTLHEKIAQMIVTYSDGYYLDENDKEFLRLQNLIVNEKIGGVIFFKGKALEEARLINKLQSLSETPLLISQDFERGTAMRLEDGSIYPSNMSLGATRNPDLAYKMGFRIAKECRALGVHQNYSPVMDVNNNPKNPIINVRSFGEDPKLVSEMGLNMIKGLQEGGVIATAKHFPGHGDTDIDTHNDLPVIKYDMKRLNQIELVPFKSAIENGVKSVMIAHISFPELDKTPNVPSSMSQAVVKGLLIDQLNFQGLIVTDALNMAGITKYFSGEQVGVACAEAGIDLILMPQGESKVIDAIEKAVNTGKITEERIDRSVTKILEAKEWLKLNENKLTDESKVMSTVNSEAAQVLSQQIADESITLVRNEDMLPLPKKPTNDKCVILSMYYGSEPENTQYFYEEFTKKTGDIFNNVVKTKSINGDIISLEAAFKQMDDFDYYIIPLFIKVKMKSGTVGMNESQADYVNFLTYNGKKVIVISFGNPYLMDNFPEVPAYICAYSDCKPSINAAIKSLVGEIKPKGKLPVTINENYKFGHGLTYK